jgi:hypothetical protein
MFGFGRTSKRLADLERRVNELEHPVIVVHNPNQLELPLDDGCCQCKAPQKAIGFRNCITCCKPFKAAA